MDTKIDDQQKVKTQKMYGTREEVFNGQAYCTKGHLTKNDLKMESDGRIISLKRQETSRRNKNLEKFNAQKKRIYRYKICGSKEEVFYGKAFRTAGHLTKEDLTLTLDGRVVSIKRQAISKKIHKEKLSHLHLKTKNIPEPQSIPEYM